MDVPRWVAFAARSVSCDDGERFEVWGRCARCETERRVSLPTAPQPQAEAALGAFALHHRGCENVVERAERVADDRERELEKVRRRLRQVDVPAFFLSAPANDVGRR